MTLGWVKESAVFIAGAVQGVQGASGLKKPRLPDGFQQSIFKGQGREGRPGVRNQLMHSSLIG